MRIPMVPEETPGVSRGIPGVPQDTTGRAQYEQMNSPGCPIGFPGDAQEFPRCQEVPEIVQNVHQEIPEASSEIPRMCAGVPRGIQAGSLEFPRRTQEIPGNPYESPQHTQGTS